MERRQRACMAEAWIGGHHKGSWEEGGEGEKRGESVIAFPKSSWCPILCMLNFKYHVIPFLLTARTKNESMVMDIRKRLLMRWVTHGILLSPHMVSQSEFSSFPIRTSNRMLN